MDRVVTAILGGGQGARLYPLTQHRAKPAVPLAGKFRLIDVPISNSIHAGIDRIYVLTQYNSASLHRHIAQTYRFDSFSSGFVSILAAEQRVTNRDWYQGTADAVRQNLDRLTYRAPTEVLVLSGDQLYLMSLRKFTARHRASRADVTVAVKAVHRSEAGAFGIMRVDDLGRIVEFVEKPQEPSLVDPLVAPPATLELLGFPPAEDQVLASMGIYVFRRDILTELLEGTATADFGHEVIPAAVDTMRCFAFGYPGYWRDIGTIRSFHQANLELARPLPPLDLYSADTPIYTHARFLPGTKVEDCAIHHSVVCEGGVLSGARIQQSVVGIRAIVREGTTLERTVMMGANRYEWQAPDATEPDIGVGRDCVIRNAILDLDARIGDGVHLVNEAGVQDADLEHCCIRGGIIVVPRGAAVPAGTAV